MWPLPSLASLQWNRRQHQAEVTILSTESHATVSAQHRICADSCSLCVIHPWRYLQIGHVSPLLSCIENTEPLSGGRERHGNSDLGAFGHSPLSKLAVLVEGLFKVLWYNGSVEWKLSLSSHCQTVPCIQICLRNKHLQPNYHTICSQDSS